VRHSETGKGRKAVWSRRASLLAVFVVGVASVAFIAGSKPGAAGARDSRSALMGAKSAASASAVSLPLFFEPNEGQTDGRVKFLARGAGYGLFLTADEAVLALQRTVAKKSADGKEHSMRTNAIRMRLAGANAAARIQGAEPLPGKSNYFIGNERSKWRSGIPQYARVEYQDVYRGIDLAYYGNGQQLEYDFRVAPGADANQIALSFEGANARIEAGDLVLTTSGGDVRFRAPHIYQPRAGDGASGQSSHAGEKTISGGFRLLADNNVGFAIGEYDHSRALVIDPVLSYSTYFGLGGESLASVAVDNANNIYLACTTTAAGFPTSAGAIQPSLNGTANLLIAVLSPTAGTGSAQLLYATYLGGNGTDSLAGVTIDPGTASFPSINIYVAGTTTSTTFPTTASAFQVGPPQVPGTHGFLSTINVAAGASGNTFTLSYSTYLAGNGTDIVTGIAVDSFNDAYVTGTTTSTDVDTGFPSTPNAYQICPFQPAQAGGTPCPQTTGPTQFFASQVNTLGTGAQSMLYSTYFGGGWPSNAKTAGGGIAVDVIPNNPRSNVNMYFTGTTNMPGVTGPNGEAPFPLVNAYQSCLNESGATQCTGAPGPNRDAILVKINPNQVGQGPSFSTYLGGANDDFGNAVAVDTIGNTYVTGGTNSSDWLCNNSCVFAPSPYNAYHQAGTAVTLNAFIAKVGNFGSGIYPLNFFAYIGESGATAGQNITGQAITVDSVQAAHVAGTTASDTLSVADASQATYGGGVSDAFAALISTTLVTPPTGNYVTYLGGSGTDVGTGIALDTLGATYVAGSTQSANFPLANPYQDQLLGTQNAFVTKLGGNSAVVTSAASGSPSPSPVPAGTQATFTFNITNNGPDPANNVTFTANVPTAGLQTLPTAEVVSSGTGSCTNGQTGIIICNVGTLAVAAQAQVAVFVTPAIPVVTPHISVSGSAAANGGAPGNSVGQQANVTDFTVSAVNTTPGGAVSAGGLATIAITLTPSQTYGYDASITLSQSASPSIVANPSPTFTVNPIVLSGTTNGQSVLNIQTVARPVNSGSLLRRKAFYAAWLPIGGLSFLGLGIGAGKKRRRWLIGAMLGLLAGLILLQPACSGGSTAATNGGGTQAGLYFITVTASAGSGASHQAIVSLQVN